MDGWTVAFASTAGSFLLSCVSVHNAPPLHLLLRCALYLLFWLTSTQNQILVSIGFMVGLFWGHMWWYFRAYFWFWTLESLQNHSYRCLRNHMGCWETNLCGMCARQVPCPLYYLSGHFFLLIFKLCIKEGCNEHEQSWAQPPSPMPLHAHPASWGLTLQPAPVGRCSDSSVTCYKNFKTKKEAGQIC